jgi:pantoate--beta-alanine ligase
MQVARDRAALAAQLAPWRRAGRRIGLVPTMGNLHAGHLALVDQARTLADVVVATVFVNPTQFGPGEDFERYPRTLDADAEGLRGHGCDLLFAPDVDSIYPFGAGQAHRVTVPALADVLCGAHRPGHFDGVATVVTRLFNLVQPALAVFGEKDFQQLRILERMTTDLGFALAIARGPTVREADGLALSSRNRYLDPDQRRRAPVLHATLRTVREGWNRGEGDAALAAGRAQLRDSGVDLDYLEVRRELDLGPASQSDRDGSRIFVAGRIGPTRLIDNLALADADTTI